MNADESGLMRWISTDEDECIATKAAEADRSGEDKTNSTKDAKRVSTVTKSVPPDPDDSELC